MNTTNKWAFAAACLDLPHTCDEAAILLANGRLVGPARRSLFRMRDRCAEMNELSGLFGLAGGQ